MRIDNLQFATANRAPGKDPQFVVAILYDVGSLYITSSTGIPNVPGIVLDGALQRPSAISQRVVPDEGRSEIGSFSFDVVDLNSDFTDEVRAKLTAGASLRGKLVRLYCGFKGFDFSAFQPFQTQMISDCTYKDGVYTVLCEDITRQQRTNVFDVKTTTLSSTLSATETAVCNVADTSKFLAVQHGTSWNDAPSALVYYFKIENEIIRATGKTLTTFTTLTRGVMNTLAAVHTIDAATPQERRLKVEEFTYLDLPAPKLALAMLTGAIFYTWPANLLGSDGTFQVDTNADGVADGWATFIGGAGDGGRVQTASRPAGSAPFSGVCQRLAITTATTGADSGIYYNAQWRSGLTITLSGYVRTNVSGKVKLGITFVDQSGSGTLGDYFSATVAGDSIAHMVQITATAPAGTHQVQMTVRGITSAGEFFECDLLGAELGQGVFPISPSSYTANPIEGVLPEHWHCGVQPELIRFADFTGIGADLWDLTDNSRGFRVRFEGLAKQDGKRFLEREIYLLLGAYSPIYSDGTLGLKRLPAMISDASPVATLTERELVSVSDLQHDFGSLHNVIRVTWAFDLGIGDYTRDTLFLDSTSIAIHGDAPVLEFAFRGLHSGSHTEGQIRTRMDALRDAYSYPPERITVTALPSLNVYEMGDVFRLQVANVRDFAGASVDIDRSFVCLRRSIDFASGDLSFELFGSTLRPEALAPSAEAPSPLPDAYYNAQGVALSTVIGITGNTVNVGTHTITGNADMTASAAVFYHLADLVIPDGAIINISGNVQLRVRGFITLNGDIVGTGGGIAGVSDPGGAALTSPIAGAAGFIGNSRGWDGINLIGVARNVGFDTIPVAFVRARYDAWPALNLGVTGNSLIGLPTDLRGSGGAPGGRVVLSYAGGTVTAGGAGVAGGAGLAIISRGMSFGVSASITLDGANSAVTSLAGYLNGFYPGCGGAGAPGALLILLDGNSLAIPNAAGRFFARTGLVPQLGTPMESRRVETTPGGLSRHGAYAGYQDEQIITGQDLSVAALRIQYVPSTQTPAADQSILPSPLLDLTVTPGAGFNTIRASLPTLGSFDVVDYYAALTNNRAGAVLISRGRSGEFQHDLPVLATRYYWARTVRINAFGLEAYSDWFPAGATSGIAATTLNPGGWTPVVTSASGTMLATSSTIEKSGGSSAWDSQAYSNEKYPGAAVSFRANDATHDFMLGLNSDPATDASYASIDFAWRCEQTGTLFIYENGTGPVSFSGTNTYDASTVLSITYDGEVVRYFRNAVLARSVFAPGLTLALDSSFYYPGSKALDVKFQSQAVVTNANTFLTSGYCRYAGKTIQKAVAGTNAWDSDCVSGDGYSEGAFASARAGQALAAIMYGLNADPLTDSDYYSIDYAWYFTTSGTLEIYESGSNVGTFGSYTTSTITAIRHIGAIVQYIKDGVVVRSAPRVATTPLYFDSSFYSFGSYLTDVQYGPAGRGAEADPSAVYLETFESPWETTFANIANASGLVVSYPNSGQFGGKVISAQGMLYVYSNENIPYDSAALYRISTRIRRTASGGGANEIAYCGVVEVSADGTTLINSIWNCANAFNVGAIAVNTWIDFVGYFRGLGSSSSGVAPNVDSPTVLNTSTRFFRPALILNYNNGSGTQECDYIKVERLTNPPDADNTDKRRIVPDPEFERSIGLEYWYQDSTSTGPLTIALTGGNIAGLVTMAMPGKKIITSRRNPPAYALSGQYYTVTCRIRRNTAASGTPPTSPMIRIGAKRHDSDPASSTYTAGSTERLAMGEVLIGRGQWSAWTLNAWREINATLFFPPDTSITPGDSKYVSAYLDFQNFNSGEGIQIDYLNLAIGIAADPWEIRYTDDYGTGTVAEYFLLKKYIHDTTANRTISLPGASASNLGVRMFFECRDTGVLTIAASGSDTLRSSPNVTGNRALAGRDAVAYAECISATEWRLVGQLA